MRFIDLSNTAELVGTFYVTVDSVDKAKIHRNTAYSIPWRDDVSMRRET